MGRTPTNFCGQRLRIAREFRALTQSELARRVSASNALISLCEASKDKRPSQDLVKACGEVLGFEPEFFYTPIDVAVEAVCSFRHRGTTPERMKVQICAHATLIDLVIQTLRSRRLFPRINVPWMAASTKQEIEMAAEQCRQHWNLGVDGPIQELRTVLEAAGAIVIDHVVKSTKVDTFSRYNASMAMIFPNEQTQSRSAWNFDVAHELGHIAMHRGTRTGDKDTERKADMFAGAFLMPSEAFGREFQAITFSWEHVFRLKKRWGVRAAAIVKRAFDLSLMGAVDCQAASKHIYREGWNKAEPDDSRAQQSGVFENALNCLGQKETLTIDLPIEKLCAQLFFTRDTFFDVTGISITQSNIAPSTNADQTVVVAASTPKPALQPVPQVAERRDMSVSTPLKPLGLRTTGICGRQDCARQAKVEFRATRFCIEHLTQEVIAATSEPLGNVQGTPSGVYGLETIPQGCKAFFLVHGDQNAVCPRRCEQLAVGVETWHCAYAHLPAFASVERLWVVLNDNEENRAFLISIAADKVIRRRCRVSIRGVQWVAKQRMLCQRRWRYSEHFNPSNDAIFEEGLEFQDCPVPSEIYKLDQLGRPKEEQDKPRQNIDWRS